MSDKAPAIYVTNSSAKEIVFDDGGSLMRIGFKVESLLAFLQTHQNEKGWINMVVTRRKTLGKFGDTHSIKLDTFKPKAKSDAAPSYAPPVDDSEIPF